MRSLLIALASLPLLTATALAQNYEAPQKRQGLEFGLGLGAGRIYCEAENGLCDSFTEAGGANLFISYMFSPSVGIFGDAWAMSHREDDYTFTHYVNTVGVRFRPVPILTLSLGVGAAHATLDNEGIITARATSDDGFAVLGAASIDVISGRRWALSVEGRFGNGFYGDDEDDDGEADVVGRNVSIGAGLTFFGF